MFDQVPYLPSGGAAVPCTGDGLVLHAQQVRFLAYLFENVILALMILVLAAQFQVVLVDIPVGEVIVKRDDADVVDEMKFARAIEVNHGDEGTRMSIEEVFARREIVIIAETHQFVVWHWTRRRACGLA